MRAGTMLGPATRPSHADSLVDAERLLSDVRTVPGGVDRADLVAAVAGLPASASPHRHRLEVTASSGGLEVTRPVGDEGRVFVIAVASGVVGLRTYDATGYERRHGHNPDDGAERAPTGEPRSSPSPRSQVELDAAAAGEQLPTRGRVTEWSPRSRARMLRAYAELDYRPMRAEPGVSAMVTLTYPGQWEVVAPTAESVKGHLRAFVERFAREYGYRPGGLWKLEFQRRGAPHFHVFMTVPAGGPRVGCTVREHVGGRCRCGTFEAWLSRTWADVVGHPDDGERARHLAAGTGVDFSKSVACSDPRRLAVYFLKHGTKTKDGKEYQNSPPDLWGVQADPVTGEVLSDGRTGRFWGYWRLQRVRVEVAVPPVTYYRARRLVRRWARSQGRQVRSLGHRGGNGGGWQLVNSGPAFAAALSAALAAG